ncbi:MAG: AI-2E family transporter [Bdellovibrionaceae bacterium]|nr:AI-2E family transporter [Pseudobdellovibrionaceae bacterium]
MLKSTESLLTAARTTQICLVILTILALLGALSYTKPVLVPLVFAIFTYAIFAPIIYWIQVHLKVPRFIAVSVAFCGVILLSTLLVIIALPAVQQLVMAVTNYDYYVANILSSIQNYLPDGIVVDKAFIMEHTKAIDPTLYITSVTQHSFIMIGNLSLVIIYTAFMIVGDQGAQLKSKMLRTILIKIFEYTIKKMFLALASGLIFLIILSSFKVNMSFVFAIGAVVLNFIPTIGPIIAVALPMPIVFYAFDLHWQFFFILSSLSVLQFIIGNIIEPRVLGDIMDLHPITVLICLVFWALIWGVSGMFLAVPLTTVMKIIFERIEATRPFAEVLAGRLPTND